MMNSLTRPQPPLMLPRRHPRIRARYPLHLPSPLDPHPHPRPAGHERRYLPARSRGICARRGSDRFGGGCGSPDRESGVAFGCHRVGLGRGDGFVLHGRWIGGEFGEWANRSYLHSHQVLRLPSTASADRTGLARRRFAHVSSSTASSARHSKKPSTPPKKARS